MFDAFDKKDDVKKQKYIEVDPFVLSVKKAKSQKIECLVSKPSSKEDRFRNSSCQQKFHTRIFKKVVVLHCILV